MPEYSNKTVYHTREGVLVYTAQSRWTYHSYLRAIKKAKELGYDSLIATEADGRTKDFRNFFTGQGGAT
ncbi:hypothetical protein [Nibribacter koreensis]|uniref:Uncharacterized protein n=1 Tax=Nibribacter koreensis TaxID=1084519 RepID=A0ABP8FB79_9BACT